MRQIYHKGLNLIYLCVCASMICLCCYMYSTLHSTDPKTLVMWNGGNRTSNTRHKLVKSHKESGVTDRANHDELRKLGSIVYRRLHFIQNPQSCMSRRKLHCLLLPLCGLGCQVSKITTCLMIAYALNRTMLVFPRLTNLLEPLSTTCHDAKGANSTVFGKDHGDYQVVKFLPRSNKYQPEFYPPAVPDDLFDRIRRYHDDPFLWWTGLISSYVFRITRSIYESWIRDEYIMEFNQPIVGVHVRRTDKLKKEASLYTLDEYMVHVERWFNSRPGVQPKIFVATDEPNVLVEISERYPHYKVVSNTNITLSAAVETRTTEKGTAGIIHDIYLLSKCDYVVCTFSSNVCRLAFQLLVAERGNVSQSVVSLDGQWFFYYQRKHGGKKTNIRAKMPSYSDN